MLKVGSLWNPPPEESVTAKMAKIGGALGLAGVAGGLLGATLCSALNSNSHRNKSWDTLATTEQKDVWANIDPQQVVAELSSESEGTTTKDLKEFHHQVIRISKAQIECLNFFRSFSPLAFPHYAEAITIATSTAPVEVKEIIIGDLIKQQQRVLEAGGFALAEKNLHAVMGQEQYELFSRDQFSPYRAMLALTLLHQEILLASKVQKELQVFRNLSFVGNRDTQNRRSPYTLDGLD